MERCLNSLFSSVTAIALTFLLCCDTALSQDIPPVKCTRNNIAPSTPSSDFVLVENSNAVRHLKTGLEWNTTPSMRRTWREMLEKPQETGSGFDGGGWRIPNVNELLSLVEECRSQPAINLQVFPSVLSEKYWTASPYAKDTHQVLVVDFSNGRDSPQYKGENNPVLYVRDAQ